MRTVLRFLACLAVLTTTGCAAAPTQEAAAPPDAQAATTVDALTSPMVVAHRGGAAVYPEETMAGFRASAESGYYPEMDVQFLADGAAVLVHDDTADRTMTGVSGPIAELTSAQWEEAEVTSPTGGDPEPAVFFEEVLDALGGTIVLVPEIKPGANREQVDQVITMINDRGLGESVVVQSFDYDTSVRVADAGLASLFLAGDDAGDYPPERLLSDGIEWFGPSRDMPPEEFGAYADAGVNVVPYTLPTRSDGEDLGGDVFGYFTDDPWS